MTTPAQAQDFTDVVLSPEALLERSVEWIKEHLGPQEVYDREQLSEWAVMNGFTPPPAED